MTDHVFIFRRRPPGDAVEIWIDEFMPEAELTYGGGLRVVVRGDPLGFHFKLAWCGHYAAHHQCQEFQEQVSTHDAF